MRERAQLWFRPRNSPNPLNVEMCLNRITRHLRLFREDGLGKSVSPFANGTISYTFFDFLTDLHYILLYREMNTNYDRVYF